MKSKEIVEIVKDKNVKVINLNIKYSQLLSLIKPEIGNLSFTLILTFMVILLIH